VIQTKKPDAPPNRNPKKMQRERTSWGKKGKGFPRKKFLRQGGSLELELEGESKTRLKKRGFVLKGGGRALACWGKYVGLVENRKVGSAWK